MLFLSEFYVHLFVLLSSKGDLVPCNHFNTARTQLLLLSSRNCAVTLTTGIVIGQKWALHCRDTGTTRLLSLLIAAYT